MPLADFPLGPLQTNSYVLHEKTKACVIDVGGDPAPILDYLNTHGLELAAICLTHLHFDHLYGVAQLQRLTKAPVYAPKGDALIADTEASQGGIWGFPKVEPFLSTDVPMGDTTFADLACRVLLTPGHTPGSVSYYFPDEGLLFSGDVLFYRSVGRTDFPMGSTEQLLTAIRTQLFTLPPTTRVFPGHGPETSIADEKANNPICGDFS